MADLIEIYVLNLLVTLAMFIVLAFRAWLELKNFKVMWKELEWRRTYETVGSVLKAERDLFTKVEGEKSCMKCSAKCSTWKIRERTRVRSFKEGASP